MEIVLPAFNSPNLPTVPLRIVADSFDRPNTTGGPGTTDYGAQTWINAGDAAAEVVSNQLVLSTTVNSGIAALTHVAGQADCRVKATYRAKTGTMSHYHWFAVRAADAGNMVGLVNQNDDNWTVRTRVGGGSAKQLALVTTPPTPAPGQVCEIAVNGASIKAWIDGLLICDAQIPPELTSAQAGFGMTAGDGSSGSSTWDDFEIWTR